MSALANPMSGGGIQGQGRSIRHINQGLGGAITGAKRNCGVEGNRERLDRPGPVGFGESPGNLNESTNFPDSFGKGGARACTIHRQTRLFVQELVIVQSPTWPKTRKINHEGHKVHEEEKKR